ncbi:MAG: polysaccharide biosynthesis/export family protein [bacterium]
MRSVGEPAKEVFRSILAIFLGLVVAGFSILAGPVGGPTPSVLAQQAPAEYVFNPGDVVDVTVLGEPDLTRAVTIRPDGKITLPLIGDIIAAGLTPPQLAGKITTALKEFLRNPQVVVSLREARTERQYVYLVGQFVRPGPVEIQKGWTLLEVMASAGGVTPRASLRRATLIRRASGNSIEVDLDKLLLRGDRSANIAVEPNDVIMLPALEIRVLVLGYVRTPGAYDLEDNTRVIEAIARAGGTADRAATNNIGVIRNSPTGKPVVVQVNLDKILGGDLSQNVALQNADVVYVPAGPLVRWTDILSWLGGLGLIRALFGSP